MKIAIAPMTVSKIDYLVEWLETKFDKVKLNPGHRLEGDDLVDFVGDCEVFILGVEKLTPEVASGLAGKKCIKWGVGIDNIDFGACNENDILMLKTDGLNTSAVSELALGYIILLLRNQHLSFDSMLKGKWNKVVGKELKDAKIGILGHGRIGIHLRENLSHLTDKNNLFYNDVDPYNQCAGNFLSVEELFFLCDLITIHIDNNGNRNHNFVDGRLLSLMRDGSYIVNTSRGTVMNYDHLAQHLPRLGGAALDVFPDEPHFPVNVWQAENAMFSSHIAGNSETAIKNGSDFVMRSVNVILGEK